MTILSASPRVRFRRVSLVVAVLLVASGLPAAPRWINDGSGEPPKLSVEQAIWAMGRLPRDGPEWTRDEKVAKIAEAGFDGFMVFLPGTEAEQEAYRELADRHGLEITLQCAPESMGDLETALGAVSRMEARGLVAMIRPMFVSYEEGAKKIRDMREVSARAGVPFYVETHRGTITQDLLLTGRWVESIPGIQLHADLSHFVISYEIGGEPAGRMRDVFDLVLAHTGMIDGRVGNGEQVQIDIGAKGDTPHARRFAGWWKRAMLAWLKEARPGDVFVFKSELGPPSYSIVDLGGHEISDRWAQALVMKDLGVRTWNAAVEEAGRGQRYEPGRKKKKEPAAAKGASLSAETALKVAESGIFALRGECFKIDEYYLSGQLGPATFARAAEKGVKTLINVRLPRELGGLGFDTQFIVKEEGMQYVYLPIGPDNIAAQAEKFLKTVRECEKPVLIQGSNGNRVWGLWALYVGVEFGVPVDATKKVAAEHDIPKLVIEDFVREYLAKEK